MDRVSKDSLNHLFERAVANANHSNGEMALLSHNNLLTAELIAQLQDLTKAFNQQTQIIETQSKLLEKMEKRLSQIEENTNKQKHKPAPKTLGKK